jgi:alpha-galactosidase
MAKVTDTDMAIARQFAASRFSSSAGKKMPIPSLNVLCQGYGRCTKNRSIEKMPMRIGKKEYARGLAVHYKSEILVTLPAPGKSFKALIGRDQNPMVRSQVANIFFAVEVGKKELFKSDVFHGGEDAFPIQVPLKGAREFLLRVDGAHDWGHGDWAEAHVVLENGKKIWLDELPFVGASLEETDQPPFSFLYGGKPSSEFLKSWTCTRKSKKLDDDRTLQTVEYTDPETKLQVICEATHFNEFPAVEWVVYFKNAGAADTPVLEKVQALDINFLRGKADSEYRLHYAVGSVCETKDFAPLEKTLLPNTAFTLAPLGGRSSSGTMPFFNLESADSGLIGAIGWTGQWNACFTRDEGTNLNIQAGLEVTHFKLHPGEQVRGPRILLLFWKGDRLRSHNVFRSLIVRHYTPRPDGKPLQPPICYGSWGMMKEEEHFKKIHNLAKKKLPGDYYWVDAGWYGNCQHMNDWYAQAGSWRPNPTWYPRGIKPVSDEARKHKMKFLLWFDAERVYKDSEIYNEHPEWLIQLDPGEKQEGWEGRNDNSLLNMADPAARKWITELISNAVTKEGIECYRQDFNFDPLAFWRKVDRADPDRQGIMEMKYIEGLYAFWDELLKRHPHLLIDNCSSGGRRLDLEMTRRSIPLWRSDLQCCPDYCGLGSQAQTFGLAYWLPFSTCGCREAGNTYDFRSALCGGIAIGWTGLESEDFPVTWARKMIQDAQALRPYFAGDFYPLSSHSLSDEVYLAFQLDRQDLRSGAIIAFRREKAPYPAACFKLAGLDPKARYEIKNLDTNKTVKMTGAALMEEGLTITLKNQPDSALFIYKKIK